MRSYSYIFIYFSCMINRKLSLSAYRTVESEHFKQHDLQKVITLSSMIGRKWALSVYQTVESDERIFAYLNNTTKFCFSFMTHHLLKVNTSYISPSGKKCMPIVESKKEICKMLIKCVKYYFIQKIPLV